MISPFDLVSISLICSDVEHYAYEYWSLLCILWRNVYWSHLHIFYFLMSVICLLLFWSWAVVVAVYSEYWPTMQIQSLQILLLIPSVCLSVDCWGDHPFFTWSFWNPGKDHLASYVWIYSGFLPCDLLVSLPVLLQVEHSFDCCGILTCFEFRKPEGPIVTICSQDFLLFGFLFSCISFSVWGFFISIVIFYFQNVMRPCQWFQHICTSLLGA